MNNEALQLVADVTATISDEDMPSAIHETIESYKDNLSSLAVSLYAGGFDETYIRGVLEQSFSSFQDQLTRTIVALRENEGVAPC